MPCQTAERSQLRVFRPGITRSSPNHPSSPSRPKPHIPHTFNLQKISRPSAMMDTWPNLRGPEDTQTMRPPRSAPRYIAPPPTPTRKTKSPPHPQFHSQPLHHQSLSPSGPPNLLSQYPSTPPKSLIKSAI